MADFEILCVTMHQSDFSKIREMNIHSNVVFANQCDHTSYEELDFDGHTAKMISTNTRGVGINRNLTLMYATADICLFADDDVTYRDEMEDLVLQEFEEHPDADVFIFHLEAIDSERKQQKYAKTRKCGPLERMPWGGIRIAFRRNAVQKANVWFTTLFGGGCPFPSGEDSLWLMDAKRAGLRFYVSEYTIGTVSMAESTWYTGVNEAYYLGRGAFYMAAHPKTRFLWMMYYAWRTRDRAKIEYWKRVQFMRQGAEDYRNFHG